MSEHESARITDVAWGRMEVRVAGETLKFRDCTISPAGAREWDWNESGTSHNPGIRPGAVEELLAGGAEAIVLSRGFHGRLGVAPETEALLRDRGVEFYAEETPTRSSDLMN